jgi:chemosensory pili system protein ChpA (sensor histidine kinase/response regulator)
MRRRGRWLYQALVEYLEELLAGAPPQPVRLFPYYRALQEMLGAERMHPADLFYPRPGAYRSCLPASSGDGPARPTTRLAASASSARCCPT